MKSAILQEFLIESFENLSNISDELTSYEKNPTDFELLNSIFRKVHTLKGSAGFLGFTKLQEVTHAAENLLDLLREKTIIINGDLTDKLLESFDVCQEILKSIDVSEKEPDKNYSQVVKKLQNAINPNSQEIKDLGIGRGSRLNKSFLEESKKVEVKNEARKEEIKNIEAKPTEIIQTKKEEKPMTVNEEKKLPESKMSDDHDNVNKASATDSVVRVNVQLLDKIMNVVGELVLNRNQILQYAGQVESPELNRLSQQLNIITSELQSDIMTTRMQPVGSVLSKFERIVRDLARSQNKKIKLELIGKDTELDKTLLEAIRDPLTHLIRNSVDHGVELPEIRKERGKNEEGKIIIRSYHEGGQVSIEIKDDGNGIDPQKVLNKAIQKGIITQDQAKIMSPKQILNIIFMPGFSTAEQVTNISGRGVGMDVVKSNIERIGGSVDIISNVGEGTTFKLKIPLTLAIVPALVVQDKKETFAIPQISLVELVRFDQENAAIKIEKLYDSEFFRLRGDLIPIFRLSNVLKMSGEKIKSTEIQDESVNVVVLNAEGKIYGLIVDYILDTEEIVVKPLSRELKALSFFAGATIMGDGKVALILDALGFYNFADVGHGAKIDKMNQDLSDIQEKASSESQELLLCELGDRRQYAIPLMLVNRLEEFKASQIEWSGDQPLIKYGDLPMPLINIEQSLQLTGNSVLEKGTNNPDALIPCVVVKIRGHLYGLLVYEIRDIALCDSLIHSDSVDRKGLLGTVFINNKTITMLDVHSILEDLKIGKHLYEKKTISKVIKVLVVEDSPLYRKVQKDFLEEEGFEVTLCNNGQDALEILNSDFKFTVIVTDIEMPVMDGWEFALKVRNSGRAYAKLPIIAVSSKVSPKDKEKGIQAGFTDHIEKLNKSELHNIILNYV